MSKVCCQIISSIADNASEAIWCSMAGDECSKGAVYEDGKALIVENNECLFIKQ